MATVRPGRTSKLNLTATMFSVLVVLAGEDMHGYAIMQAVNELNAGSGEIGPTTLYRSIRQLLEAGAVVELARRPGDSDDPRRRYYRITTAGKAAAAAEAQRLSQILAAARSQRALKWRTA